MSRKWLPGGRAKVLTREHSEGSSVVVNDPCFLFPHTSCSCFYSGKCQFSNWRRLETEGGEVGSKREDWDTEIGASPPLCSHAIQGISVPLIPVPTCYFLQPTASYSAKRRKASILTRLLAKVVTTRREKRLSIKVTQLVGGRISVCRTSNSRLNAPKSVTSIIKGPSYPVVLFLFQSED